MTILWGCTCGIGGVGESVEATKNVARKHLRGQCPDDESCCNVNEIEDGEVVRKTYINNPRSELL